MASQHYSNLKRKIVFVTLCFSLIPLLALGLTIYYQFSAAYSNRIKDDVRTLAENERSSIEMFLNERVAQLLVVANTQSQESLQDEAYLQKVFDSMQARFKSYIDIGVIEQNGNHLAYVGPHYEKLKAVNYSQEDWFHAVMSTGVYISDVFLGFRKIPHFIIAVRRIDRNKSWILRATINSDVIDSMVRKAQVGKKGDAFIINNSNILQTPPRFSGTLLGTPKTPDFSSARGTAVREMTTDGEKTLFATSGISSPKWVLVVSQDPEEEMSPLFRAGYIGILVMLGGVLLIVMGTVITSSSITNELIRIEREKGKSDELVVQSSKMAALGKMAAGIAHEINNPLAIIGEKAGWMKDLLDKEDVSKSENFKEFEDCIKKIERQVERSRTITHRLLRFGRRMEPTQEMVDVNQILAETITFLENEAHHRNIEIRTSYSDKLPRITTDSAQLQQVFLNIINNGIDAVGKDGYIDVKTVYDQVTNDDIMIDITDNGPGIPREILPRIFDPFFTTKSAQDGTGLGLSISYSIIEKLGGKIAVNSTEGKGTSFKISVPAKWIPEIRG
ncbi:MAG TPA: ATP-binding protein [Desulfomonilaceae bacterium]|nr:ATP-binding protein [Desulfomonilaceae bacterium]